MKSSARNINLTPVEDLFSTEEGRMDAMREKVQEIKLAELYEFSNHPFKVLENEEMDELVKSVSENGILVPAIARPRRQGGYELISGHRRKRAGELAGKETIPVIVREIDNDAAAIIMVDSNLQRESILPSERAFAYKIKLEAMKRQAGRPSKENVSQLGTQKRSDQLLAEQIGESRNQIQRYIRLTELIPEFLDMVDEKSVAINTASELSYLKKDEQAMLFKLIKISDIALSLKQAQRLKKYSQEGKLNEVVIDAILTEGAAAPERVVLKGASLKKYFPPGYTTRQMEETILRLLEKWNDIEII